MLSAIAYALRWLRLCLDGLSSLRFWRKLSFCFRPPGLSCLLRYLAALLRRHPTPAEFAASLAAFTAPGAEEFPDRVQCGRGRRRGLPSLCHELRRYRGGIDECK